MKHFTGQVKQKVKHLGVINPNLRNLLKKETLVINMIPGFFFRAYALGGREQIRTAVQGFADLCLTARPRDQLRVQT